MTDIARTAEEPNLRISAADKLLNRIEGFPVAKVETAEVDPISSITDGERDAELERQRALVAELERLKQSDDAEAVGEVYRGPSFRKLRRARGC